MNNIEHISILNEALSKATTAASFFHEEPYRTLFKLQPGDNILTEGITSMKTHFDELQQENTKLRQQVSYLQTQLRPPEPPKRELKYWIVTGLGESNIPFSATCQTWPQTMAHKQLFESRAYTHIRILEQIVYV